MLVYTLFSYGFYMTNRKEMTKICWANPFYAIYFRNRKLGHSQNIFITELVSNYL
jgi:hypothetical protein